MITERGQRNNDEDRNRFLRPFTRRSLLGAGSSAAAALLTATVAGAQLRTTAQTGARDHSASDPGPENRPLLAENPSSSAPREFTEFSTPTGVSKTFFEISTIYSYTLNDGALKSKRCSSGHLLSSRNLYIRKNGTRECRQCSLNRSAEFIKEKCRGAH